MEWLLAAVVVIALVFDFTNGFHDAANAVATSISTRAIPPNVALFGAAVLNVAGALVSTNVAATLAKGIVESSAVTGPVMFGGLLGAITWNLLTWWWALPSSSSHCLVGGVAGAVIATTGSEAVKWGGIVEKVLIPTVIAPIVGFTVGIALMVALLWAFGRAHPGLIPTADVPLWVKLSSAVVIGLGTYSGGKRIIRTLGMRLVKLTPMHGFAAETAASAVLMSTAHFGFPVSTTHVISTSIMGVGATQRLSAVKWGLTRDIFLAWILTLPAAGLIGGLCAIASKLVFGDG